MHDVIDFLRLYDTIGFGGICIALLVCSVFVVTYEVLKKLAIRLLDKYLPEFVRKRNPLKASFFNKLDVLIYYKVPRLSVYCPLRKLIFSKLLKTYFQTWKDRAQEKVVDPTLDRLSNEEYTNFWKNFVYKTVDLGEERARQEGIPLIAVEKFRKELESTLRLIISTIDQVCGSYKVYDSNTEKTIAILDFLAILLDMSLIDAEKTIMAINGELSKIEYMGCKCDECTKDCIHKVDARATISHV